MSYHRRRGRLRGLGRLGEVADLTDKWGSIGTLYQSRPDKAEPEAFVYGFELVRSRALSADALISLAEAVVQGAAVAGYAWDAMAVVTKRAESGLDQIQVVVTFADWTFTGDLGKLNVAINAQVVARGLGEGLGAVHLLRLTGPEGRYFSAAGGLAPLVISEGGQAHVTKAAANPSPKQMLTGDVRALPEATTFSTSIFAPPPAGSGDTMSTGTKLVLVAGVLGLFYVATQRVP